MAQVIVAKCTDHQPLHRQEKMFERHGIDISRKTMGGWMAQSAQADAYSVYDAFFKPQRGMTEVGCWMHAPRPGSL